MTVQFLSVDEVLVIHRALIEHYGGPPGVRDLALLESALYRPRSGYYADLMEMAAALIERRECDFVRVLEWLRTVVRPSTRTLRVHER